MSLAPRPTLATLIDDAGWDRLLPALALFVRLAIGLGMLNIGLSTVFAQTRSSIGPAGWSTSPGWPSNSGAPVLPGVEAATTVLPYLLLGTGVGLVLGAFTTACALMTCGLVLVFPLYLVARFLVLGSAAGDPLSMVTQGIGTGLVTLVLAAISAPVLTMLVLLSPTAINRYSIDSMIFQRRRIVTVPGSVGLGVTPVGQAAPEVGGPGDVPLVDLKR